MDYVGPFLNKMFLVVVDAYSKWLEVVIVPSATSLNTIRALRSMLSTHGLPELLVSDNGTAFTSSEFREFLKQNGIRQATSAPKHSMVQYINRSGGYLTRVERRGSLGAVSSTGTVSVGSSFEMFGRSTSSWSSRLWLCDCEHNRCGSAPHGCH